MNNNQLPAQLPSGTSVNASCILPLSIACPSLNANLGRLHTFIAGVRGELGGKGLVKLLTVFRVAFARGYANVLYRVAQDETATAFLPHSLFFFFFFFIPVNLNFWLL